MKTRIITAVVGLGVLAVVLGFFDTFLFDLVLSAICLIAIHEVFSAMGFGKKQWYLYAAAVPLTLLVMLSTSQMVRSLLLPAAFLTVLFYNVCQIAHVKTLDFGKLTGFVYFSGVITFCFYSLIHLKRMLPFDQYRYDAIYFILLILCFAWGGDTAAYFAGRAFGKHKLAPKVSPKKTVEGAIGGLLGGVIGMTVFKLVADSMAHTLTVYPPIEMAAGPQISWGAVFALGIIGSTISQIGDLSFSVIKREFGVKDYGNLLPGHGGILDRFDSVMFIAPFVTMVITAVFYQ